MDLSGKRLVITGANGGLGRGVVDVALACGASVVLLDIAVDDSVAAGNDKVSRHAVDLTDAVATAACFDAIGDFDGVINLAGGFAMGPAVHDTDDELWEQMFEINVTTLRRVLTVATPRLLARGRGVIVNVGALGARSGQPAMGAYCAAKSTVMRLTESLSAEVRDAGVNVNAVLPSLIDTPRNRADMPDAEHERWLKPADLGNVIAFLASDAASAVHGALVPVTARVD